MNAVDQVNALMKLTNAKTAMVRKSLRRRKFSKQTSTKVLHTVKNTSSTVSLMSIQTKRQEMW